MLDEANVVTLGEGFTPIFKASRLGKNIGCNALYIKDEGINPTASFKARGLGAAVSKAKELGITALSDAVGRQCGGRDDGLCGEGRYGCLCVHAQGRAGSEPRRGRNQRGRNWNLWTATSRMRGRISAQRAEELGLFDVSTLREPYRVEGKKTMGYEIAEQMGMDIAGRDFVSDGRRHRHRWHVEGVRRDGGDGLD